MTRYAVFLRAVNLGSHNKVPMPWLREALADAGYRDVATYVQSGNVVLTASDSAAAVAKKVHDVISAAHGLDIDVVVRSKAQLAAVVENNPFPQHESDQKALHVTFLESKPAAAKVKALDSAEFAPELFELRGSELYLWFPAGYGRSKMATAPWAKRLGVKGTDRNWRTVLALLEMLGG